MIKSKTALRLAWQTLVVFMILFVLVSTALAATWVFNKLGSVVSVWAPQPVSASNPWENGNPKGYAEGDTAAIAAPVIANVTDGELLMQVCLDQTASQTGAYAFTNVEPWDKTLSPDPDIFPDGTPVDYTDGLWDTPAFPFGPFSHPDIWGHNIDILEVMDADPGDLCGPEYIGWRIRFIMMNDGDGYIVYGAHIATPGDPIIYKGSGTVPDGMGARAVNGVFQIRNIVNPSNRGADKTVNFKSSDLLPPPNAITLLDFGASSVEFSWIAVALVLGVLLLLASLFVFRRAARSI